MIGRYFGKISFPNTNQTPFEGVWLVVEEKRMYVEITYPIFEDKEWSIVLGDFTGINKVTFIGARLTGGSSGSGGSFRKMVVNSMLIGDHISTEEELKFKNVILRSSALLNWFSINHTVDLQNDAKSLTIPESLEIFSGNYKDFCLRFSLSFGAEYSYHNISINHLCFAKFEYGVRQHLSRLKEDIYLLRKFVLFFTNTNPNFEEITIQREENEFIKWVINFPVVDDSRFSMNILTYGSIIQPHLNEILKHWFEKDKFQYVIDLLLEKYFNTELSIPRYFQSLCVALESFHSNFIQKKLPVSEEIVSRRNYIQRLLQDDPEILKWFNDLSNFWIDPQFVDRLNTFRDKLSRVIGNTFDSEIDSVITKIKQTRNEITHVGMPYKRFNHIELILIAKAMEFTLKLSVLELLGVEIDQSGDSLIDESSSRIRYLARLNNYIH